MTELVEEGLLTQQEVEQMWEGLPKVANRVKAAGAPGTEEGMLINLEGFLEFDRKVNQNKRRGRAVATARRPSVVCDQESIGCSWT